VVWDSHGLSIVAANSSLIQILKDISAATGAKVEGLGVDERIFGTYGPGQARDVISQLLDGSGYNVLMVGDQGEGTPRQIELSNRPNGPAPVAPTGRNSGNDEETEAEPSRRISATGSRQECRAPRSCSRWSSAGSSKRSSSKTIQSDEQSGVRTFPQRSAKSNGVNVFLGETTKQMDRFFPRRLQAVRAGSGWRALTAIGGCWGRSSANPTRRIAYAARIPNAIAPTAAQTSIARFNKSAIVIRP
jgi:hypothetical protein